MENNDGKSALLTKIQQMPDELWKKWQIGGGVFLGLVVNAILIFLPETPSFGSLNLILAALIALVVPRLAEKKLERDLRAFRTAMIITLAAGMVAYGVYLYLTQGFGG